jgi:two-component system, chemotaxis family, CheB/CheR fusion protein
MATVFLDNALHMHRFTIHATRRSKLILGGIGRPLTDLVTDLIYPGLRDDAKQVLRKLAFRGEIATSDGRWSDVKIMPYRTLDNVIDGVVITFHDNSN